MFATPWLSWSRNPSTGPRNILHGAEAHVGSRYGELTRIVVLSLDVGSSADPDSRNLRGRRNIIENIDPNSANAHMYGTFETLHALLGPDLRGELPWPFFALLNAAKCSASNTMDKVPDSLYWRCCSFAESEIEILQPEIVVAQGTTARNSLRNLQTLPSSHWQSVVTALGAPESSPLHSWLGAVIDEYLRLTRIGDRDIVTLLTPHPSDRQGRWQLFRRVNLPVTARILRDLCGMNHHRT